MRNLKRVLSLALALVMMLSLMVVSSSAKEIARIDFTDADEIEYKEAVDVMVALGVIDGGDQGAFEPDGILTREQAAKVICYMLLGPENAENLTTNTQIFTDVAAGRWSAGYISYCANLDILAGTGEGTFLPAGELTGVTFGKMLLVALGYRADIEGYVGDNWATAIASDMVDAGIAVNGVVMTEPLTREQAAQMAFQTLEADMVKYGQEPVTVNMADGTSVIVNAPTADSVKATGGQNYNYANNGTHDLEYLQFCEKYFDKLKKNTTSLDDFGCPTTRWSYTGVEIGKYAQEADHTYLDEVKMSEIYKDLGLGDDIAKGNVLFTIDGVVESAVPSNGILANDDETYLNNVSITKNGVDKDVKVGGKGAVTQVYYNADATNTYNELGAVVTYGAKVRICVTNYYLAKATSDYDANDGEVDIKVYSDLGSVTVKNDDVPVSNVAKDDYLVVTIADDEVKTVAIAEIVEDVVVSAARNSDYVTAGQKYEYSAASKKGGSGALGQDLMADATKYSLNDETYNLYLDPNGFVLGVEGYNAGVNVSRFLFVKEIDTGGSFNRVAKAIFSDGHEEVITVSKINEADATDSNFTDPQEKHFYRYSTTSDGRYKLTTIGNVTDVNEASYTDADLDAKVNPISKDGTRYADSTTVFIAKDKVYTGVTNAPKITSDIPGGKQNDIYYIYSTAADSSNRLLLVYNTQSGSVKVNVNELTYIMDSKVEVNDDNGTEYYVYKAFVNGKETTVAANNNNKPAGLYKIDTYTDGRADLGSPITTTDMANHEWAAGSGVGGYNYANRVLTVSGGPGGSYILSEDVKVFVVNEDEGTVRTTSPDTLGAKTVNDGFTTVILVREEGDADANVAVIYVVKPATPPTVTIPTASATSGSSINDALTAGGPGSYIVNAPNLTGATVDVAADQTLTITGGIAATKGGTLTGAGDVTISGGTVAANVDLSGVTGTVTLSSTAVEASTVVTVDDVTLSGTISLGAGATLDINGIVTVAGATITAAEDAQIIVQPGADVSALVNMGLNFYDSDGTPLELSGRSRTTVSSIPSGTYTYTVDWDHDEDATTAAITGWVGDSQYTPPVTVTLTNSNATIAASAGTNGAYTVEVPATANAGDSFTVTVKCTSVDAANTVGETVTVTYNSESKTVAFTEADSTGKTVTFTAAEGATSVTATVAATPSVTLTTTDGTIAAVGGTNGAYTVELPSNTKVVVGASFTVTVKCESVDGANTNGETVTVTYNNESKTVAFTEADSTGKTVTFTAVAGQTAVTASVAAT